QHVRTPSSERRPEERRRSSNGIFQSLATILQLLAQLGSRKKNQVGMAVAVIADRMPRIVNGSRDLRPLAYEFPDQEKGGFGSVAGQYVEQATRMGVVGPVIVGQRNLFRIATVGERAPVKLRPWRHGCVSSVTGNSSRRGESGESGKHKSLRQIGVIEDW